MSRANLKESLFGLSKWVAFILGFGALFAGETQASQSQIQPAGTTGPSKLLGLSSDEVLVRVEDERIYISQGGSTFKELSLADGPTADYFKALLRDANSAEIAVPIGPIIVANGGGGTDGNKPKTGKKKTTKPTNPPPAAK